MRRGGAGALRRRVWSATAGVVAPLARLVVLTLGLLVLAAGRATAQDLACEAGDREVQTLRFAGNRAFPTTLLAQIVATTPSSALSRLRFLGTRRCLDPEAFQQDVLRLQAYYRRRGYPRVAVDTVVRTVAPRTVEVTFRIAEGTPLRLDSVRVVGLDSVREGAALVRNFPLRAGSVYDRVVLEGARDSILARLRDTGYPAADALLDADVDSTRTHAWARVRFLPGTFTRLGDITIVRDTLAGAQAEIPERVIRRTLGLRPGDPFSARDIVEAQRTLYQTEAYRRVDIRVDTTRAAPDSIANLLVTVAEGRLHAARVSTGWATLDCFRTQGDLTSYYFLPRAQRLELTGRVSRIGIGAPLDGFRDLCSQARQDIYSDRLNYYAGATVRQPTFFRLRRVPSLTLFTSRVSEFNAFRRTTVVGGLFTLAARPGTRFPTTATYQLERGRTEANAAIFCALFFACQPEQRAALSRVLTLGALGYSVARNRADDPLNPTRGTVQRLTLRHASRWTGSDATQRFTRALVDASWYRTVGGTLLTARLQGGALFGDAPPQERLFAGGPTTVRGFRQNELGPVVYVVSAFDTLVNPLTREASYLADPSRVQPDRALPTGGNALVVANLEAQFRSPILPDLLSLAAFADAGSVWDRRVATVAGRAPRVTPGAGIRIRSPFGPIRIDLAYNGYDQAEGAAYYISEAGRTADGRPDQALYCVSPGNGLVIGPPAPGSAFPTQQAGTCRATYF